MSIDRRTLVKRHDPELRSPDPTSPLSVGNGEFAFTADVTGLQTFLPTGADAVPLCTMAQWAFHSFPGTASLRRKDLALEYFDAGVRNVGYMTAAAGQEALFNALRRNPHRLNLGRIGFASADGGELDPVLLAKVRQRLDLWSGRLESEFEYAGSPFRVSVVCHPRLDALSFRAEAPLGTVVALRFPYGSIENDASDWHSDDKHRTEEAGGDFCGSDGSGPEGRRSLLLRRVLDGDRYYVALGVKGGRVERSGPHTFLLRSEEGSIQATFLFSLVPPAEPVPDWDICRGAAARHWEEFWTTGAAIELARSADPRALELERRIVLSRYLTAIQCAGSLPPQETGLTCNSWYGKFHLEMHFWHAAHFALWGKAELLERSLGYYFSILDVAKRRAGEQGYAGARWPKMSDPSGEDSPSPIGPLLCWQQPHPIFYAELMRRFKPVRATLEKYAPLVFESAAFMADYARAEEGTGRFVLGPPLIPAQESHEPRDVLNPTYELEYWRYGLSVALEWRRELGLGDEPRWRAVLAGLAAPPVGTYEDGRRVYLAHERCPRTFQDFAVDHPSMLCAFGLLNGERLDSVIVASTYDAVLSVWDFESTWGWDFPVLAMTAARLGRGADAVDALLMETPKNTYRPNGHNAQLSRSSGPSVGGLVWNTALPVYLPGNGSLLYAIGLMAAGWDGGNDRAAPGFPDDGTWTVEAEGFMRAP